jgi:hypothetical protein
LGVGVGLGVFGVGDDFGVGEDFGVGDDFGVGEDFGVGDDFGVGEALGVGEAFGDGEGDGAAATLKSGRQKARLITNERKFMDGRPDSCARP